MRRSIIAITLLAATALAQEFPFDLYPVEADPETACLTECCKTLKNRAAQTYHFYQNTGHFVGGSGEWAINTHAYSGAGEGLLNPKLQCKVNVGPLPAARYKIGYCKDTMHTPAKTRPCSFYLEPQEPSKMCGRSAFFIHGCACCTGGDHTVPPSPGCSAGCIVMNVENRMKLRAGDTIIVNSYE
jgi:hypothetical protein